MVRDKRKERKLREHTHGEGTVFQRKRDEKWVAKYQNRNYNGGKPITRLANSEREPYAKLECIKRDLFGGKIADGTTSDTVEDYVKRWLNNQRRSTKRKRALRFHIIRLTKKKR